MTRSGVAALLFLALLGAGARAQPGRPGRGMDDPWPPPDLRSFAAEVSVKPTDARTVHPRMRTLMMSLRMRGIPPSPEQREKLDRIRGLLGDGKLTKAAKELDAVVQELAADRGPEAMAAPALARAAPAAAAALPAAPMSAEPALQAEAPRLLSAPIAAAPIARALPAEPAALPEAARAVPAAPAPSGPPWPLIVAGLGLLAFGGAAVLFAASRKEAPAAPAPGRRVLATKYELGPVIASGGMGEVYEGRDLSLRRRVAVKRMLAGLAVDEQLRAQFLKEARFVGKLTHPYIVPIHDCVDDGGDLYLVFEFVEGETLARRLTRDARLPLKEAKRVLGFVAQAIEYAHGQHVLHRDIKPGNIMLGADGIARVMDFGIALESTRTATSATGGFLDASGTLRYMPPEQHYGKSVRQSDVYAMGVCLYETVTGHPPFAASDAEELLALKRAARFPPPSAVIPGLPTELDLLVAAALAPDAAKRVSSAAEFRDLLEGLPG